MFGGLDRIAPDKVAAYIRWSTEEQGNGTTLEIQRERVDLFIRSQGWRLRDELTFIDDGFSGASLRRPAMEKLRKSVLNGDVDCVVVYKLDRLSRSLLDTVTLVRQEWRGKAVLCSATEHFDTESPVGQMVFNILVSFAEFERNLIRERTLAGKRKRAEQGRNAGQKYPFGFRKGGEGGWQIDRTSATEGDLTGPAAIVRRIFSAYLAGQGMPTIAMRLNGEGVCTPEGRRWRASYVGRILGNPLYAGIYRYGRQRVRGVRSEGSLSVGVTIPSIISRAEFERVAVMRRNRRSTSTRAVGERYLLTGLLRCGQCGAAMAGSRGRRVRYYVCTRRTGYGGCDAPYITAAPLEAWMQRAIRLICDTVDVSVEPESWAQWHEERQRVLQDALASVKVAARRSQRLSEQFLKGAIDARPYGALLVKVEEEARTAAEAVQQAEQSLLTLEQIGEGLQRGETWSSFVADDWRGLLFASIRALTVVRVKGKPPAPVRVMAGLDVVRSWSEIAGQLVTDPAVIGEWAVMDFDVEAVDQLRRVFTLAMRGALLRRIKGMS